MKVTIRCSKCREIIVYNNRMTGSIKVYDIDMPANTKSKGIMCKNCGHYISEEKIREVVG